MKQRIFYCPTCQKEIVWSPENPYRPFCSQRCQLIDLGAWANEEYTFPDSAESSASTTEKDEN